MATLIALLGHTPGAVTGSYYALARDEGIPLRRVVTVTTNGNDSAEDYVAEEFARWRREGHTIEYDDTPLILPGWSGDAKQYREQILPDLRQATRIRIPFEDVNSAESVDCLREVLRTLLATVYREEEVHVSVAGGRKSMAAIATLAAQLYGYSVKGLYHLYVKPEIPHPLGGGLTLRPEEDGRLEGLNRLRPEERERLLRPEPDEVALVPLSFFRFEVEAGKPRLELRGEMQEYLLDYLAENDALLQLATYDTNDKVIAYLFEEKVADHLRDKYGWRAVPRAVKGWFNGDFDVWAEKSDEILICECKHQDNPEGMVEKKKFRQAQDRLIVARRELPHKTVTAWVVSNSKQTAPGCREYMLHPVHPVEFYQAHFNQRTARQFEETKRQRRWLLSLREPWLEGEFTKVPPEEVVE